VDISSIKKWLLEFDRTKAVTVPRKKRVLHQLKASRIIAPGLICAYAGLKEFAVA
jgi:hypothetical protein